jgi:hypothetical protein
MTKYLKEQRRNLTGEGPHGGKYKTVFKEVTPCSLVKGYECCRDIMP